jgi:hypothetical protein
MNVNGENRLIREGKPEQKFDAALELVSVFKIANKNFFSLTRQTKI